MSWREPNDDKSTGPRKEHAAAVAASSGEKTLKGMMMRRSEVLVMACKIREISECIPACLPR
jgi:hypothetical protein